VDVGLVISIASLLFASIVFLNESPEINHKSVNKTIME
jgi:hypothetical protein